MTNQTIQFRETLYQLRMDYGTPTDVYRILTADTDVAGVRTWQRKRYHVPKGILFPSILSKKYLHDLSAVRLDRHFVYGGDIDLKTRLMILDRTELPKAFEITTEDMIVCNMLRYSIKQIDDLDYGLGYMLSLTNVQSSQPYQELSISVGNTLVLSQGVSVE